MKKRICPICEQEMKSRHYCRVCKKFIKNPIIRDVNYRLNEGESLVNYCDCDYHTPSQSTRPLQGSIQQESVRENQRAYKRKGSSVKPTKRNGSTKKQVGQIILIVVFFWVLNAGLPLLNMVMRGIVSESSGSFGSQDSDVSIDVYEEENYYTDEEVQAQGVPCNGYAHFSIRSDALTEQLIGWARQNVGSLVSSKEGSENVAYPDSDLSYYDSYMIYYFPSQSDHTDNYIEIGYDTVSTQVHYVIICLSDEGKWLTLTEKSLELLAAGEENLTLEDTGLDRFRLDYVTGRLESDSLWETDLFDAYFYRDSNGVPFISIYRMER